MVLEQPTFPASTASASTNATMAATASTTSFFTMAPSSSTSQMNLVNQPLLFLSNMSNMMTVKLDNSNYIVWQHQISMVLETYSMIELLDEDQLALGKFLKDFSGSITAILSPDYLTWKSKKKALLIFISSTLTPSILALTIGCSLALEVWRVSNRTRSTKLRFDELATMLNAKEESLNGGMEIKDSTFSMAVNTAPKPGNNISYNSYNQSSNRGRGK
nr:hypothetical protein CFP56_62425 [Quercus suber]